MVFLKWVKLKNFRTVCTFYDMYDDGVVSSIGRGASVDPSVFRSHSLDMQTWDNFRSGRDDYGTALTGIGIRRIWRWQWRWWWRWWPRRIVLMMCGLRILIGGRRIGDNANAHFIGIIDNVIVTVPKNERRRSGAILYGTIQTQLRAFFDVAFCASLDNGIRICKKVEKL